MAKIAVLGVSGFVGSHIATLLLAQGHDVVGGLRQSGGRDTDWLKDTAQEKARKGTKLSLVDYSAENLHSTKEAINGACGVICSAGSSQNEPKTINLMEAIAKNVSEAAIEAGIPAVFTSSTGSTNPPEGEPKLKNEIDHWSDTEVQIAQKKYAAAGKTFHDRIIMSRLATKPTWRAAIINPSMVTGPCYQEKPVSGLIRFAEIINGETISSKISNSSMSMIDVRDLATLHVAALFNKQASGRYFGVKRSWHWQDILATIQRHCPSYKPPALGSDEEPMLPTAFDLTRQQSLGVPIRNLDEIIVAHIKEIRRFDLI